MERPEGFEWPPPPLKEGSFTLEYYWVPSEWSGTMHSTKSGLIYQRALCVLHNGTEVQGAAYVIPSHKKKGLITHHEIVVMTMNQMEIVDARKR